MATDQEKEQLMETLKFVPCNYRIEIGAYGGEIYFGSVDRKIYDFFKQHKIDIEEYANSWDEEMWEFVPEDMRPFEPGSAFDCDNLAHNSGATLDSDNAIVVYDEKDNEVWRCNLDIDSLSAAGLDLEEVEEFYVNEQPKGTVVFYGAQGEKGVLFGNEFELHAPFDPKNIKITYGDYDGWQMVSSVLYNGEDIDNNNYNTSGKWGEAKWIIVDDEEEYIGVSRDDIDDDDNDDNDDDADAAIWDQLEGNNDVPEDNKE